MIQRFISSSQELVCLVYHTSNETPLKPGIWCKTHLIIPSWSSSVLSPNLFDGHHLMLAYVITWCDEKIIYWTHNLPVTTVFTILIAVNHIVWLLIFLLFLKRILWARSQHEFVSVRSSFVLPESRDVLHDQQEKESNANIINWDWHHIKIMMPWCWLYPISSPMFENPFSIPTALFSP